MLVRLQPPDIREEVKIKKEKGRTFDMARIAVCFPHYFCLFPFAFSPVLVEQPGVLATLSRWRSWVQIPSGTLAGTVRKLAKRPSSNLGDRLWVRFPPVLLKNMRRLGIGEPKWL